MQDVATRLDKMPAARMLKYLTEGIAEVNAKEFLSGDEEHGLATRDTNG